MPTAQKQALLAALLVSAGGLMCLFQARAAHSAGLAPEQEPGGAATKKKSAKQGTLTKKRWRKGKAFATSIGGFKGKVFDGEDFGCEFCLSFLRPAILSHFCSNFLSVSLSLSRISPEFLSFSLKFITCVANNSGVRPSEGKIDLSKYEGLIQSKLIGAHFHHFLVEFPLICLISPLIFWVSGR